MGEELQKQIFGQSTHSVYKDQGVTPKILEIIVFMIYKYKYDKLEISEIPYSV